jgi:hypothetical protein
MCFTAPATVGNVTAAVATIYITFQIYFDWMRHLNLAGYRQLLWTLLHFPVHLSLTLFVEGTSQFVIWLKISEVLEQANQFLFEATSKFVIVDDQANIVNIFPSSLADGYNKTLTDFFTNYPPRYIDPYLDAMAVITNLKSIPDIIITNATDENSLNSTAVEVVFEAPFSIETFLSNSIFTSFNFDAFRDIRSPNGSRGALLEDKISDANAGRIDLIVSIPRLRIKAITKG